MTLTKHGRRRLRGRIGLSGGAPDRMAARVLERGLPMEETRGLLRDFLAHKATLHDGKANNARLYGEHFYLFAGDVLITVMHVPPELRKEARKAMKRWKAGAA